jgi:hypothetical protein
MKGRPEERRMDGVGLANHGLTEKDTKGMDMWRNIVLGEGKPLCSVHIFGKMNEFLCDDSVYFCK